jgi:60 kDa SS-A/Ro ribonucleoprotein
MARFSTSTAARSKSSNAVATRVVKNNAGGAAYAQSPKLELVNLMLSNFLAGDMYRSEKDILKRVQSLITQIGDKAFLAKAALYARNEFGMRTMSHLVAGEMATQNVTSGTDWGKVFYDAIVYRVDDMMEIMGYYFESNPKASLPAALKRGFASAIGRFDAYQLAKYRGESKSVKLVDVVRLVRPKPTRKNAEALKALLEGTLKNENTWEAKISKAGQAGTAAEKAAARQDAWAELLLERRIGYLALVRNLTNIANDVNDAAFEVALELLTDKQMILASKIFPFQLYTAFSEIDDNPRSNYWGHSTNQESRITNKRRISKLVDALGTAMEISLANLPKLEGKTLVAIDTSGSMSSPISDKGKTSMVEIAALFGIALAKATDADVISFNTSAKYLSVPKSRSLLDQVRAVAAPGGGTNFEGIFSTAGNTKYDRIFILSDMQAWMQSYDHPRGALDAYKTRSGANPYVYSFDLHGHGTMQVPENDGKVIALAGWSEKIFDILDVTEQDREALIHTIEEYPIAVPIKVRQKK